MLDCISRGAYILQLATRVIINSSCKRRYWATAQDLLSPSRSGADAQHLRSQPENITSRAASWRILSPKHNYIQCRNMYKWYWVGHTPDPVSLSSVIRTAICMSDWNQPWLVIWGMAEVLHGRLTKLGHRDLSRRDGAISGLRSDRGIAISGLTVDRRFASMPRSR